MNAVVIVAAWLIVLLLLTGVGVVIWLGVDTVIRGWQLLEQARRDRQDKENDR